MTTAPQNAYATYTIQSTDNFGRSCLKGIVDIESDVGWLGFASVFGFTQEEIQAAAYVEAERRAVQCGLTLQWLRFTKSI